MILVLARLRAPLAAAIFAGTIAIGLLFGLPVRAVLANVLAGALQPAAIGLMLLTACLLALSGAMQTGGQMTDIVVLAQALLRRPVVTMAALPALIGLLPMPGGALFSAPMVESAANGQLVSGGKLSAINYWFRHVWEYWWPLYPGVILAVTLTGMDFVAFATLQLPLSAFMILGGLYILWKLHPSLHKAGAKAPPDTRRKMVRATSPIWIILVVWGAARAVLRLSGLPSGSSPLASTVETYLPVLLGLLVSLVMTMRLNRFDAAAIRRIWTDPKIWQMLLLVASVMIFQYMLASADAAEQIGDELAGLHVPVLLVLAILPFIAGMVTGLAVGFVGTSFPIVLGLVSAMPESPPIAIYVPLAYLFGHMGQMLSPLHLCHVVSNRYFQTGFAPVYRQIAPAAAITMLLGAGYFFLLLSMHR